MHLRNKKVRHKLTNFDKYREKNKKKKKQIIIQFYRYKKINRPENEAGNVASSGIKSYISQTICEEFCNDKRRCSRKWKIVSSDLIRVGARIVDEKFVRREFPLRRLAAAYFLAICLLVTRRHVGSFE